VIALLALAALQPALATPPPANEIVVIAERMSRIKLSLSRKKGVLKSCKVKVSSGDPVVDSFACEAVGACMAEGITKQDPLADCATDKVLAFYLDRKRGPEASE
jgi:hypothetical protein